MGVKLNNAEKRFLIKGNTTKKRPTKIKKSEPTITVGFCSKYEDKTFYKYIKDVFGDEAYIINEYGVGETKTLTEGLNNILRNSKTDRVILCHNDIVFENCEKYKDTIPNMFNKLFDENEWCGIIGVIGGTILTKERTSWAAGSINGHFIQEYKRSKTKEHYENHGTLQPFDITLKKSLILDGLFMCVSKSRLKTMFNETNKTFHYYDIEFCVQNSLLGTGIGVTKCILIRHKSEGDIYTFNKLKPTFLKKYGEIIPYYGESFKELQESLTNRRVLKTNTSTLPFDETYVVHISSEKDRYTHLLRNLNKVGISDQVNIWWTTRRGFSDKLGNLSEQLHYEFYQDIHYGAVFNCAYEHYQIIKTCYYRGLNSVLIMEDDITFNSDINNFNEVMKNVPKDYDVIKFYYYEENFGDNYLKNYGDSNDYFIDITKKPLAGTVCYALSRRGMKEYLEYNKEGITVADSFYHIFSENGKIYGLNYKYGILDIEETTKGTTSTIKLI